MEPRGITLHLDVFEGPLDLLLYLIKKHDLEISRISLAAVTDQYLGYLDGLKELDVDGASEFLLMAAELAHIKSRTLLPGGHDEPDEEDEVGQDLVARLREYERYKMAAEDLNKRAWLGRDVFGRASLFEPTPQASDAVEKRPALADGEFEVDSFELIKAYYEIVSRLPREAARHQVMTERISVADRIYQILELFKEAESVLFADIFPGTATRVEVVVTFLALLEMARLNLIQLYQTESFAPIRLKRRIEVRADVLFKENLKETLEGYQG